MALSKDSFAKALSPAVAIPGRGGRAKDAYTLERPIRNDLKAFLAESVGLKSRVDRLKFLLEADMRNCGKAAWPLILSSLLVLFGLGFAIVFVRSFELAGGKVYFFFGFVPIFLIAPAVIAYLLKRFSKRP